MDNVNNGGECHMSEREKRELECCCVFHDLMGAKARRREPKDNLTVGCHVLVISDRSKEAYLVCGVHQGYLGLRNTKTKCFRVLHSAECRFLKVDAANAETWFADIIKNNHKTKEELRSEIAESKWWAAVNAANAKESEQSSRWF